MTGLIELAVDALTAVVGAAVVALLLGAARELAGVARDVVGGAVRW